MRCVILIGILLLVLFEYAVCCVSHDADEIDERMYKEWRKQDNE